jgi:hypothetical protein
MIGSRDITIRRAVFEWLTEQRQEHGEALSRASLESFKTAIPDAERLYEAYVAELRREGLLK